ncbi:MAG: amidohydrolase family protein [Bacteroidota bacterium]
MERRKFFYSALSVGTLAMLTPENISFVKNIMSESALNENEIAEWNVHFFSSNVKKYPFHPKATYKPDPANLPGDPLEVYLAYLKGQGIGRGVVVQPEPYGDDHSLILDCLERAPGKLKGTSLFYPKDPKAPAKLSSLIKQHPEIVSTRFHAHRGKETYLDSFADPGVRALWKQAVDLDLVIELHIGPNYALQVKEAINAFPGCKVLIDHFAEPHMGNPVEFANVLSLADLPNVYMKFSGLSHFADDGPDFLSAIPFTSQVFNAFGPDRMVMGGVSPNTVKTHMEKYSSEDVAKVTGTNILKLLKWK